MLKNLNGKDKWMKNQAWNTYTENGEGKLEAVMHQILFEARTNILKLNEENRFWGEDKVWYVKGSEWKPE